MFLPSLPAKRKQVPSEKRVSTAPHSRPAIPTDEIASLRRAMVAKTHLQPVARASNVVPKWQQTTSREPACHALGRRDPGSWPHPISWLPKLFRTSKMESDPQMNSRPPHLPPPPCQSQDRGRRQHDAFTTSSGGNRGTTIEQAHSRHRRSPQKGQRAGPAFNAETALQTKCLATTAKEHCPSTTDHLHTSHKLRAKTEAEY